MDKLWYLFALILVYTVHGLGFKGYVNVNKNGRASFFLYIMIALIFMALISLIDGGLEALPGISYIYALMFGLFYVLNLFSYSKAIEIGPLSYSSLFNYSAMAVPMLCGILFWDERISVFPIIGCAALIAAFYILTKANNQKESKFSLRWLVYCLLAFTGNAVLQVINKMNQQAGGNGAAFSMWVAICTLIPASFMFLYYNRRREKENKLKINISLLLFALLFGFCSSIGTTLYAAANANIHAVILYPVVNGSLVITMTVGSVLIFKEKISRLGTLGMTLGLAAGVLFGLNI